MICNYLSKIIPALQSRCTRFRFGPLSQDQMIPRLEHVIRQEKWVFRGSAVGCTTKPGYCLTQVTSGGITGVQNYTETPWFQEWHAFEISG